MEYIRITSIEDPLFAQLHRLLGDVFPADEVLAFEDWAEPLKDDGLRVYVAVHEGKVVGATEYRYYPFLRVAMTDFTIIGQDGLGIGPFLLRRRAADIADWVARTEGPMLGMFAEIYNPEAVEDLSFGGVKSMHPIVRREVLFHIGYRRLDMDYVHPSWQQNGEAVGGLQLGFLAADPDLPSISGSLVAQFLRTYYAPLEPKPKAWYDMVEAVATKDAVRLLPL